MEEPQLKLMGREETRANRLAMNRCLSQSCLPLHLQLPEPHTSSECSPGNFPRCDTSFPGYEKQKRFREIQRIGKDTEAWKRAFLKECHCWFSTERGRKHVFLSGLCSPPGSAYQGKVGILGWSRLRKKSR